MKKNKHTNYNILIFILPVFYFSISYSTTRAQEICKDTYISQKVKNIENLDIVKNCKSEQLLKKYGSEMSSLLNLFTLAQPIFAEHASDYSTSQEADRPSKFETDVRKISAYVEKIQNFNWGEPATSEGDGSESSDEDASTASAAKLSADSYKSAVRVFNKIADIEPDTLGTESRISYCKARLSWRKARALAQGMKKCTSGN